MAKCFFFSCVGSDLSSRFLALVFAFYFLLADTPGLFARVLKPTRNHGEDRVYKLDLLKAKRQVFLFPLLGLHVH